MRTKLWGHDRPSERSDFDYPTDELLQSAPKPVGSQRADCCIAAAAYRVILPATLARPRPAELLLCRHHYRCSRTALTEAGAAVFDTDNRLIA